MTAKPTQDAARPIPASIPMPDSPIRQQWAYQLYARLARPSLDWIGVLGAAWALGLCDLLSRPMGDGTRIITLAFVGALYGVRTVEKGMGVA